MNTYTLRQGDVVTSKDGDWPTQYTNRTQAARAAAKIPGADVIQRGRPFYVRVPISQPTTTVCTHAHMVERPDDMTHAWQCADCGYIYGKDPIPGPSL